MVKVRSGRREMEAQGITYLPPNTRIAPNTWAIALATSEGKVSSEVPESTIALNDCGKTG